MDAFKNNPNMSSNNQYPLSYVGGRSNLDQSGLNVRNAATSEDLTDQTLMNQRAPPAMTTARPPISAHQPP